jgi:hypothetical protein
MTDKARIIIHLKDDGNWIDQLMDVVGEQAKTIHECLNSNSRSFSFKLKGEN